MTYQEMCEVRPRFILVSADSISWVSGFIIWDSHNHQTPVVPSMVIGPVYLPITMA